MGITTESSTLTATVVLTLFMGLVIGRVLKRFSSLPIVSSSSQPTASKSSQETHIVETNAILLLLSSIEELGAKELTEGFCGVVATDTSRLPELTGKTVYLCGDIGKARDLDLEMASRVLVVRELSYNSPSNSLYSWPSVGVGCLPILVHRVGVYYRRFFDTAEPSFFERIRNEHSFQTLTESNKPSMAHRTAIYLTPVERRGEQTHFHLLRCSSNLSGPTDDFGPTDTRIVDSLNREANVILEAPARLNHVLAQIYRNTPATGTQKQAKAKIKAHSDKTKDMPANGLIAFCTFYDELKHLQPMASDPFDYGHYGISALTKLHFRLKPMVAERPGCTLSPQFSITLYPDSVFFIPLSTNRMYTHEIRPAALDASLLPTRIGYVVRCSNAEAVHSDGRTYIRVNENLAELQPPTREAMAELRQLYAEENITDAIVDYSAVRFSMNQGDYMRPTQAHEAAAFRRFHIPTDRSIFEDLAASALFEPVAKGRFGTVLVLPHEGRGVPVVRSTTKYARPAQTFLPVHVKLAQLIQEKANASLAFNNALLERYTNAYTTMGFHSDQELDLEGVSCIAVFSCYKYPELADNSPRKLMVQSKGSENVSFEIPLLHGSAVVFSVEDNRKFKHKIVLTGGGHAENEWIGVTFRTSKTFVQFSGTSASFENGAPFTLADADQQRHFFTLRHRENAETDFAYPQCSYTISASDLMPPLHLHNHKDALADS